jgi:ribose-phosphate pyrophosphokinase
LRLIVKVCNFVSKLRKMEYLNLDQQFQPFGKSIEFYSFTFNGGEPHFKIKTAVLPTDIITITTRICAFNDLGFLLLANDALRRMGVRKIHLFLPYFPAARQDRVMVKGEPLTVKIYANLINNCQFETVTIVDPHSEVTAAVLDNVRVIDNHLFVKKCLEEIGNYQLISPDGGALKKVYKLALFLGGKEVIECSKRRDVNTGNLTDFAVYADDLQGKTCVIVDDICDGGGTFLGLAAELKKKNAGELILVVTHGLFSKGLEELGKYFSKIYAMDSFSTIKSDFLTQIPLTDGLLSE